jgi:hypothetical protein
MEVEAGMNMENLIIMGKASLKVLSFFWPVVVVFVIGMIWYEPLRSSKLENE